MLKLETERLIIRDHIKADIMPLHGLLSDKKTMYFLQDLISTTLEESEQNLSVSIEEASLENRSKYFFAIQLKDDLNYVGEIGFTVLIDCPEGRVMEMGYFILPEYWGLGIVTEAARRVIQFAFEEAGVVKIEIGCNKENIGSERIMQKLGLIKEAELKKHSLLYDRLWDRVEYRVLKEEWPTSLETAIRPSADLRNHYNEISKQCKESRDAVIITVNGRGDTAVLGLQDYYQMKSELELLRTLAAAEDDVEKGRMAPMQDSFDDLRASLLKRKNG